MVPVDLQMDQDKPVCPGLRVLPQVAHIMAIVLVLLVLVVAQTIQVVVVQEQVPMALVQAAPAIEEEPAEQALLHQ